MAPVRRWRALNAMARAKIKADCRADTKGGSWAGIPKCLIDSPAYRALSLHARAVLVEMVSRMNGYNNGSLTAPQRDLIASLRCSASLVSKAIGQLIEHGIVAVEADAKWKSNRAREYRLTFVTTKGAGATNDYLRWTPIKAKSIGAAAVSVPGPGDTAAVSARRGFDTAAVSRIEAARDKVPAAGDTPAVRLINNHTPELQRSGCERCGAPIPDAPFRNAAAKKRFCSEQCRKAAESARGHQRRRQSTVPHLAQFMAGQARAAAKGGKS